MYIRIRILEITSPRKNGKNGQPLPSTRLISNKLFRAAGDCTETDFTQTLMVMVWGQFIDHDIVSTPVTEGTVYLQMCYRITDFIFVG